MKPNVREVNVKLLSNLRTLDEERFESELYYTFTFEERLVIDLINDCEPFASIPELLEKAKASGKEPVCTELGLDLDLEDMSKAAQAEKAWREYYDDFY